MSVHVFYDPSRLSVDLNPQVFMNKIQYSDAGWFGDPRDEVEVIWHTVRLTGFADIQVEVRVDVRNLRDFLLWRTNRKKRLAELRIFLQKIESLPADTRVACAIVPRFGVVADKFIKLR